MLSPSRPSQKICEEDSSGSDAGSEVDLEPKTDRFGFIVTNGSTAGSVGPPPELVRQREAKWINVMDQWDRILMKKPSKVKVQCQKGIPASLRAKCWPLLCGATVRMKQNENLYQSLDSQLALQSWVDVIERDLDRQFPFHEMFLSKDGHGQRGLFRVLKAYTQYQPEEGYCQAQGPVAAVLLMNMPAEEAFWCLVQISEQYLPGYYSPLLEGVLFDAAMLTWVLKRTCPAAHKHLQHHGVEPLMFATDWLMCLFTRHLPFNTLLRVWDLFFCYGVRVLFQVAVVLVRRVLGRAEQRKRCHGQMETLERLRGIREEVHEEDDAFIAEVCSVQLSARDLERRTEKELEKWRKDRPSSTFDPRGRCHGYRMAWARARQSEEERDREEREKGNLSVPLARSASTLSLSPSLLHKRWRKGGKVNTGEWEDGSKVARHLSMEGKEDWRSWTELHLKKVQGVQEEEEHDKQSEARRTVQKELLEEPKKMETIENTPPEHVEETDTVKEHVEHVETGVSEEEENQLKETEESKETEEPTQGPADDQAVENILQPSGHAAHHQQGEELDVQPQVLETEVKDTNEETDKQVAEGEQPAEAQKDADANTEAELQKAIDPSEERMIQAAVEPEESSQTENVPPTQLDTVTEVSETITETSPDSETDSNVEAPTVKDPTEETDTQQQQASTESDKSSQEDTFERKYQGTDSLAETGVKEESHAQTETETGTLAQTEGKVEGDGATLDELEAEIAQRDSEQHMDSNTEAETSLLCPPACIQPKEGTDLVADTEAEAETPNADTDTVTGSRDTAATEPTQAGNDETQAEETQRNEEVNDSVAPSQEEEPSTQAEAVDPAAEHDGKASSVEHIAMGDAAEEESTENVEESTVGEDDVFISTEPTNPRNPESNPQVQDKDSDRAKGQTEPNDSRLTQANFCVRKSSSPRGCRLERRLSEDLFITPQKTSQSQFTPNRPEVEHMASRCNPGVVNPTQTPPEVTLSLPAQGPERTAAQREQQPADPPKRFGLFRRLRGEQRKNAKVKVTPKMPVPQILIQDFSDGTGKGKPVEEEWEEKLSSRERRRRRREQERREKEEERVRKKREKELEKERERQRREKEEERVRKKREKELEKERERQRRKPQTRGKSFQVQRETGSGDGSQHAKTGSQTLRLSASYADSYF